MINHLKGSHNIILNTLPPKGGKKKRSFPSSPNDVEDDPPTQPDDDDYSEETVSAKKSRSFSGPLDACLNSLNSFSAGGPRDSQCIDALLYMIAKDTMPLNTPDRPGFQKFTRTLQPHFKIPSTSSITRRLEEKYEVLSHRVACLLEKGDSITLTVDLWTLEYTMESYLGMTAHIRIGTQLHSFELAAVPMKERKTKENLQKAMRLICQQWKINYQKLKAVVTDGGNNIKAAAKAEFGDDKHITCLAHQFNIIGQKVIGNAKYVVLSEREEPAPGLPERESDIEDDEPEEENYEKGTLKELLQKVKKIVKFFKTSEIASTKLSDLQRSTQSSQDESSVPDPENSVKRNPLKLIQEVRTRWNSCSEMIERYLLLAPQVTQVLYEIQREKSSKAPPPDVLSPQEEAVLKEVRDLLTPLARATKELSTDRSSTLSKCVPIVTNLRRDSEKYEPITQIGCRLKRDLIALITEKFVNIEGVKMFAVATLCNPRFKKLGFYADEMTPIRVAKAISWLGDLVKAEMKKNEQQTTSLESTMENENIGPEDDFWGDFDREAETHTCRSCGNDFAGGVPIQVRMYLDSPLVSRKSTPNPLVAWEVLKGEYKHLYPVAQEYLSILATSVPAERLFSHAGLIASQLRTRLLGKHLNMLVFLRSCSEDLWF